MGIIGAIIAGWLFNHIAAAAAARLNPTNALVAALTGAVMLPAGMPRHVSRDVTCAEQQARGPRRRRNSAALAA